MNETPSDRIAKQWGANLRQARIDRGFTQVTFAEATAQHQTTISRFERGEAAFTPDVMLSFAVVLDTTVKRLFPWPDGIEDAERYRRITAAQPRRSAGVA